jgi:arginase
MRRADNPTSEEGRMPRRIELIGVASGLGGADPGCAQAPARLQASGLEARLRSAGVDARWGALLAPPRRSSVHGAVAALLSRLAAQVATSVWLGQFPCVIGGDHSCAAGTWAGAARGLEPRGRLGLVWIDAHMDAHTPGTSPSGRLHGMPLAALLGRCDDALEALDGGALDPRNVSLVGVRSHEPEEAELLAHAGVRVFAMAEVRRRGLARVLADALEVANDGTAGYGVTLDLDALDPREAPAVATPAAAGISGDELSEAFAGIGADARLAAFELAEYCPRLDRDGRTEALVHRLLAAALGGAQQQPQVLADTLEAA